MSPKPTDELLDHEYDGIQEFDNPIPAWWTWMWVGSMVFSLIYFVHYHVAETGQSVLASYEQEVEYYAKIEAERRKEALANINEDLLIGYMKDDTFVEAGKAKFGQVCAACHGQAGEGAVGPNLTDSYWIHSDGTLMSIRSVIANGVLEKGMPAWEKMMSQEELAQLVAYVGTLRNTNVKGKAAEGEEVKQELAVETSGRGGADSSLP